MKSRYEWLVLLTMVLAGSCIAGGRSPPPEAAVELSVRSGDSVESALAALNARGFRIVYSSAVVRPDMVIRTPPAAARIDDLLRELLSPWNLHAVRASNGDWLVAPGPGEGAVPVPVSATEDIETIDVTATHMRLAVVGASETFLDRKDVERMPHLADDAMRMLKVLPGVSGGDFSAALNVRGGRRDEVQLTIDGAEIHNAFHFRDLDGAFSVLDTHLVEGMDFVTGGMTADFADYMSGAVNLQTHRPRVDDQYRNDIGISFVSAFGRSSGTFGGDRGSWLISARRGFLDQITSRVVDTGEQLTPRYTDVFASADYGFSARSVLAAHLLFSDDDLRYVTDGHNDDADSAGGGRSLNAWLTFDQTFTDALKARTLFSTETVSQSRDSEGADDHRSSKVYADNRFRFLDLRQDWSWAPADYLLRWGFNLGQQHGDYDYALDSVIFDPLITPVPVPQAYGTIMSVEMRKAGIYGAWRQRLGDSLTAEVGGRWDHFDYGGGLTFDVTSPRLNLVYSFGEANELRAAWGTYYQPQSVNELQVEDDVTQFFAPEKSQQWVLGYTRRFPHGLSARLDVYEKRYSDLRPRYENGLDSLQLIPEGSFDRIRIDAPTARARGVEVTVRREAEAGFSGWASFAYARAEDDVGGTWYPRAWQQQESLSFGISWTGALWNASLAGLVHSGTPTTPLHLETPALPGGGYDIEVVPGEYNSAQFGAYARVDLRVNRDVLLANSKISFYMEVTNLLNRQNECCVEDFHTETGGGTPQLVIEKSHWLPLLPSFGFQWQF